MEIKVLDPAELHDLFDPVFELYEPVEEGKHFIGDTGVEYADYESLTYLIDEDWELFSEDLDDKARNALLDEILRGHLREKEACLETPAHGFWERKEKRLFGISPENTWRWFANHLKTERRFIIDHDPSGEIVRPETWLRSALEDMGAIRIISDKTELFRARVGFVEAERTLVKQPRPADEMGAPPPTLATASRANPYGISMFYAAFDKKTAVAEAGRFPGVVVSVRRVAAKRDLRLADLTKAQEVDQPFGVADLELVLRHSRLLNQLNIELSRPVHPDDSGIEYIPTQYLAEAIRAVGYDGICYKSSLNKGGENVVVFDPNAVTVSEQAQLASIDGVELSIQFDGMWTS